MPKSLDENARNQPTNPPFSSGLPLYKGEERWWVGWVQPNINPTSTQHQPTPRNYAAFKGIIL
jgi:hypothetical protein